MATRPIAEKPADRTLRVWCDGRDITDEDPRTWHWPYSDWFTQGWRPAAGPNSAVPGLIEGGVGRLRDHSTSEYESRPVDRPRG